MIEKDEKEKKILLTKLIESCIQQDEALRSEFQIGNKFRFIRERLLGMADQLHNTLVEIEAEAKKTITLAQDEIMIYVYLYNASGLNFPSWQKMVNKGVFYEYSVNRPIYTNKETIASFIRAKANKTQHGYLTFAIKNTDLLPLKKDEKPITDNLGNQLSKIREGSLKFEKLIAFTYQESEYTVQEDGHLVKKEVT